MKFTALATLFFSVVAVEARTSKSGSRAAPPPVPAPDPNAFYGIRDAGVIVSSVQTKYIQSFLRHGETLTVLEAGPFEVLATCQAASAATYQTFVFFELKVTNIAQGKALIFGSFPESDLETDPAPIVEHALPPGAVFEPGRIWEERRANQKMLEDRVKFGVRGAAWIHPTDASGASAGYYYLGWDADSFFGIHDDTSASAAVLPHGHNCVIGGTFSLKLAPVA